MTQFQQLKGEHPIARPRRKPLVSPHVPKLICLFSVLKPPFCQKSVRIIDVKCRSARCGTISHAAESISTLRNGVSRWKNDFPRRGMISHAAQRHLTLKTLSAGCWVPVSIGKIDTQYARLNEASSRGGHDIRRKT